ncbi:nlf-1, partial [Pristionchus pacificus]
PVHSLLFRAVVSFLSPSTADAPSTYEFVCVCVKCDSSHTRIICGMVHHQWSWRKRRRRRRKEEDREKEYGIEEDTVLEQGIRYPLEEPSTSRQSASSNPCVEKDEKDPESYGYPEETTRLFGQNVLHDGRSYPHERIREQKSTYTRHQRYHSPRGGGCGFLLSSLLPSLLFFLLFCFLPPPTVAQDCVSWTKHPWSIFSPSPTSQPDGGPTVTPTCFAWSSESPSFLCEVKGESRRDRMGQMHLLYGANETSVTILDMLLANTSSSSTVRLRAGISGGDCLVDDLDKCTACFRRIDISMQRLKAAKSSFEMALNRFDCLPAVDTASATRPFSPNASCRVCKMWYKRWLASELLDVWNVRPCIDWCYSAQLACPHLATSRVVDYAGHPSFQCTDLNIPLTSNSPCSCVHPCDITGIVNADDSLATSEMCIRRAQLCSTTSSSSLPSFSLPPLLFLSILALIIQYSTP